MKQILLILALTVAQVAAAIDHKDITSYNPSCEGFILIENGQPIDILIDPADNKGVIIAANNLQADFERVCGTKPNIKNDVPQSGRLVIAGTLDSKFISQLVKAKHIDVKQLKGKVEKYIMTTVYKPLPGIDEALVIAGSDRRGAIYGIYELSEQIGVSPWYDWADVPVVHRDFAVIQRGTYTAGEPGVRYRGLFLNDEAPCLTGWVEHTYGTKYGDHRFYARVFELILRLRGNFLWPAMWGWSFYADDPLNSATANDMGVIMGTSHHEPMARNHQEWARHRREYGEWNYATNQKVIDDFFRLGMERAKDTEDLITIGMRGDGDTAMGGREGHDEEGGDQDKAVMDLLRTIVKNQRQIIKEVTGQPAEKRPQVWALYKEVQRYYDMGLRMPDDVIMLLSDDNWGDVRKLPDAKERLHKGGWGMYYHVDYVGAPRNSKWLNVTPIQNMWEQLQVTYDYGVDKLWVLNVGDLKPMEYPITYFLNMAWNPTAFTVDNILDHTRDFFTQQLGEEQATEAARILNLYCKYAGRCTAEMLDANTYNLQTGEWKQVADDFARLEVDALRQYMNLDAKYRDAYKQLVLFPVQAMANIYDMYYSQAMNRYYFQLGDPRANEWADRVEKDFKRDKELSYDYNNVMAGGKWKNMMIQKHIGYTNWNDNFPEDIMPRVSRIDMANHQDGGYMFAVSNGVASIEAEHYFAKTDAANAKWAIIPYMGRTLSGISLQPYSQPTDGASLTYKVRIPQEVKDVELHVIIKSTLAFANVKGHRFTISIDGSTPREVNYNHNLNEEPQNVYSRLYPTVARRIIDTKESFTLSPTNDGYHTITLKPIEPGTVFEKLVLDCGGYQRSYLFMDESPYTINK